MRAFSDNYLDNHRTLTFDNDIVYNSITRKVIDSYLKQIAEGENAGICSWYEEHAIKCQMGLLCKYPSLRTPSEHEIPGGFATPSARAF